MRHYSVFCLYSRLTAHTPWAVMWATTDSSCATFHDFVCIEQFVFVTLILARACSSMCCRSSPKQGRLDRLSRVTAMDQPSRHVRVDRFIHPPIHISTVLSCSSVPNSINEIHPYFFRNKMRLFSRCPHPPPPELVCSRSPVSPSAATTQP